MEIEILNSEKNDVEVKIDNVTIAEILRVYLNQQGIDFVAWRREHPTKPAVMNIKTEGKTVKKVVGEAVLQIKKDLEEVDKEIKK